MLVEPVDLDKLIAELDFSEENVIKANREQATLFLEASRYRVKKMRNRIQAEAEYESRQAEASIFLRGLKKKGSAITEGYIRDKVSIHPKVIRAREKFDKSQAYEEWSKLLLEAYRQRGHAIKTLAELLGAEANAQARLARKDAEMMGFESLKKKVRKRFSGTEE